ncbi:MAG: hypothetical protein LBJ47_12125 [Tannerella sp.]|nr:hypothetical protein [Tannerella sp.]
MERNRHGSHSVGAGAADAGRVFRVAAGRRCVAVRPEEAKAAEFKEQSWLTSTLTWD